MFSCMTIDRGRHSGRHLHEAGPILDFQPEPAEILGEFRTARGERYLRQKPKGMEERRVFRCTLQRLLGGIGGGRCYLADAGAKPQLFDDVAPLPRRRKNAQPHMAHFGFPPAHERAPGQRDEQARFWGLLLT